MDKIRKDAEFYCRNLRAVLIACGARDPRATFDVGNWRLYGDGRVGAYTSYLKALRAASHWREYQNENL